MLRMFQTFQNNRYIEGPYRQSDFRESLRISVRDLSATVQLDCFGRSSTIFALKILQRKVCGSGTHAFRSIFSQIRSCSQKKRTNFGEKIVIGSLRQRLNLSIAERQQKSILGLSAFAFHSMRPVEDLGLF